MHKTLTVVMNQILKNTGRAGRNEERIITFQCTYTVMKILLV